MYKKLEKCLKSIREKTDFKPEKAVILGSGLGDYAEKIKIEKIVKYTEIEGFPVSTVQGHKGQFVFGYVEDIPVVLMQGRVHYYEGYPMQDVVLPTRLMKMMGADTIEDHADYRLMSKRALDALSEYEEVNLFLRGMVPMIGFETDVVYYQRHERFAGESKYPLGKMLSFAVEGITSFSTKPIRMITGLGFFIFSVSIALLIYFLIVWALGYTVTGWTTIVISVWGIGGLQLLALGVIGEYIGKTYLEVKKRPRYKIESILYTK